MKRRFVAACLSALIFTTFISCKRNTVEGHGESGTETRAVSGFSRVDISAKLKINIRVDSTSDASVTLSGYKNILELIKTEVRGNTLYIDTKKRLWFRSNRDVTANVVVPSLTYVGLSGTGDVLVNGYVKADKLDVNITGAGNMVIRQADVDLFDADLTGVGDLRIVSGKANQANITISGAGEVDADDFVCQKAKIKVSGVGDVSVHVEEKLDAYISGAGDIKYSGHPVITKHVTGVGDINNVKAD